MGLFTGGAEEFRREVCRFLTDALAPERVAGHRDPVDRTGLDHRFEGDLQREAGTRGYLGISIGTEHGGGGRPPEYAAAFQYECAYHDAPLIDTAVTLAAGPVIRFGTDAQRAALLPRMLSGRLQACIAYTEPEAGNDIAAVATTAEVDGHGYRLEGTKTLVTGADKADLCLTVAVTDPLASVRERLTMFVVDMRTPGVTTTARPTMAGYALWDVHFAGAAVGPDAVLGTVGDGWRQLAAAVEDERNGMFSLGWCQRLLDDVRTAGERDLSTDPVLRRDLVGLWLDLQAGRRHALRLVRQRSRVTGGVAKVHLTELATAITRVGTEVAGLEGAVEGNRFCDQFLFRFDGPVSVGANELHRSAIAKGGLGLPGPGQVREALLPASPRADELRGVIAEQDPTTVWSALRAGGWLAWESFAELASLLGELGRAAVATPIHHVVLARALGLRADDGVRVVMPRALVPFAASATRFAVAGDPVVEVPAGDPRVTIEARRSVIDDGRAWVRVAGAEPTPVEPAEIAGTFALCAEVLGASAALVEQAAARAAARVQFGAPVASFQAVQHRAADMLMDHLAARGAVEEAAAALDAGQHGAIEVAAAKVTCAAACARVAVSAHQIWGGTGYLADAGLHRWTRLIKAHEATLGTPRQHQERLASLLTETGRWSTH